MHFFIILSIGYILSIIYTIYKASNLKTLYLWSPVIALDISYFLGILIPFFIFKLSGMSLSYTFDYIIYYSLVIHLLFHFLFKKYNYIKYVINFPPLYSKSNNRRKIVIICASLVILLTGIHTGVTLKLLAGGNIEDLRRTAEIGIGFIRDIPMLIIQIGIFVFLLLTKKSEVWKIVFVGSIALVLFISTGNKAPMLNLFFSYLSYVLIKYRGLKFYEYLLFYFAVPIGAAFFNCIRQGSFFNIIENFKSYLMYGEFLFRVNTVKIIEKTELENSFLNGKEFIAGIYKIIPRFIWKEKPLSFDYYYKELIGYDFEGGGTPIPLVYRFYTNFGADFYIFYILWLFLVFVLYLNSATLL